MKFRVTLELDVDDTAYFLSVDEDSHESDVYLLLKDILYDFGDNISVAELEVSKTDD